MHVQMRASDRLGSAANSECSRQDSLALGIFLLDENGIIRYCNERLLRRIEASFETVCGQSIKKFMPDFPVGVGADGFGIAVATTAEEPELIHLQLQKGGVAMVRFTASPILKNGRSALVVIIEEINSMYAVEQTIIETRDRL